MDTKDRLAAAYALGALFYRETQTGTVDILSDARWKAFRAYTDAERVAYMEGYREARKRAHDGHRRLEDASGLIEAMNMMKDY